MDRFFSRNLQFIAEEPRKTDYFFADANNKKQKINYKEVSYIESAGNYVIIHGDNNLRAILYTSMNAMQDIIPTEDFIRIHKSFIISIHHIHALKGNEVMMNKSGEIVELPMGVTYKNNTLKRLKIKE
jgi:DNA-binding LytR/AlgR family response regulator